MKIKKLCFLNHTVSNFEISSPGLYGFVGSNGSGKSTFFSILSGETKVSGSEILLEKTMYISSLQSFDKNLSGNDYLNLLNGVDYDAALELVKNFEASSFINKKIGKYSLGMLQQLAIIVSLAVESKIVILDEIHSGLDIKRQKIFYKLLEKEKLSKIIILTSHHLEDIEKHCDTVFLLNNDIEEVTDFSYIEHEIGGG